MNFQWKWFALSVGTFQQLCASALKPVPDPEPLVVMYETAAQACRLHPEATFPVLLKRIECDLYKQPVLMVPTKQLNNELHLTQKMDMVENEVKIRQATQQIGLFLPFLGELRIGRIVYLAFKRDGFRGATARTLPEQILRETLPNVTWDSGALAKPAALFSETQLQNLFYQAAEMNKWITSMQSQQSQIVANSFGASVLHNLDNLLYNHNTHRFSYVECCGRQSEPHTLSNQNAILALCDALSKTFSFVLTRIDLKCRAGGVGSASHIGSEIRLVVGVGPQHCCSSQQQQRIAGMTSSWEAQPKAPPNCNSNGHALRQALSQIVLPYWI